MRSPSTNPDEPAVENLLGQVDAAQQIDESRIRSQSVPDRLTSQIGQPIEALLGRLLEPVQRLIVFSEAEMSDREGQCRCVSLLGGLGELLQNPSRFLRLTKAGAHVPEIGRRHRGTAGQGDGLLYFG